MKKPMALLVATVFAASGVALSANAMTPPPSPASPAAAIKIGFICGPGYHLGPAGKACWPNAVMTVPPHWMKACPPAYDLGPKGHHCWHN